MYARLVKGQEGYNNLLHTKPIEPKFKKWLESKGVDPSILTDQQLLELVKKAIADLSSDDPPKRKAK